MTSSNKFDIKEHYSWLVSLEISKICKFIFDKLDLNYLDYARFYSNGECSILYTDKEYVQDFLNHEAYDDPPPNVITPGLHLWNEYIDQRYLKNAATKFNHSHGITIINQHNEYTEVFNIATHVKNQKIYELYLNQQTILQQLVHYFKRQASKYINHSDDNRIVLPEKKIQTVEKVSVLDKSIREISSIFADSDTLVIKVNNVAVSVSQREAQCLYLFSRGLSSKEIARKLLISHRTVEGNLDRVRHKTFSKSRIELMCKIDKRDLETLVDKGIIKLA